MDPNEIGWEGVEQSYVAEGGARGPVVVKTERNFWFRKGEEFVEKMNDYQLLQDSVARSQLGCYVSAKKASVVYASGCSFTNLCNRTSVFQHDVESKCTLRIPLT